MDVVAICRGGVQSFRFTAPASLAEPDTLTNSSSRAPHPPVPPPALGDAKVEKVAQWAGAEAAVWSPDGQLLAIGAKHRVLLCRGETFAEETSIDTPAALKHILFSPLGTFLMTCGGDSHPDNDIVAQLWNVETGKELIGQSLKSLARQWPLFTWSGRETFAFQTVRQTVRIFDASFSRNFATPIVTLPCDNATFCVPSPETSSDCRCYIAVFAAAPPKVKSPPGGARQLPPLHDDHPAVKAATNDTAGAGKGEEDQRRSVVTVFDISALKERVQKGESAEDYPVPLEVARTPIGKASDASVSWNSEGTALLILAHYDVDEAHQYYEGSSSLHFIRMPIPLRSSGGAESEAGGEDQAVGGRRNPPTGGGGVYHHEVVAPCQGPVHDVQWCPSFNEFVLSHGPMPPQLSLCSGRTGEGKLSFGKTRRNTLRFNPFGRLLAFGGFGNLPGDLDIWDKKKREVIGSTTAACTVQCEWGPDGRHILASTISPRLRVDNCIRVYHYTGVLRARVDFDVLYHAAWRPPHSADAYSDLPPTPGRSAPLASSGAADVAAGSAPVRPGARRPNAPPTGGAVAAKTEVYRPPGSSGVLAARLRAERDREQQQHATTLRQTGGAPGAKQEVRKGPPGSAPVVTPKAKKKGKKKKPAGGGEQAAAGGPPPQTE